MASIGLHGVYFTAADTGAANDCILTALADHQQAVSKQRRLFGAV